MVNYVGFKKCIFAFALAILILICLCCAVLLKSGEDYTKKVLALASDEAVEIKEIFDFEFDRAYVFDEPYLSGEGLAEYYDTRQALISPIYDYVLCEHGNYVAVGDLERNVVVIYDMFDNDNIISIIPLENLLITTDDPIEWASFANNMGDIDISYRTPDGTKNIRSSILN